MPALPSMSTNRVRGRPALVAVAHGSRDPRSAATISRLIDEVRQQRPDLDVRLSFLDLRLGHAVVVPLLLGNAFHARVAVPGAVTLGWRTRRCAGSPRSRARLTPLA